MNELMTYVSKEFGSVRTINENGKVLFSGKDVAEALGYKNTRDAIARHCKGVVKRDGVSVTTNQHGKTTEQKVEMSFITEGDLYRLVANSELPGAEKFESWVFDEVLPTIRRQGYYSTLPPEELAELVLQAVNDKWKLENVIIPALRDADINQCMLVAQYMGLTADEFSNNPKLIKKSNKNLSAKNMIKSWERMGWQKYSIDDFPEEYRNRPQTMLAIDKTSRKSECYGWFAEYCGKMYFNKYGYVKVIEQMEKMGYITDSKAAEWKRELETQAP